MQILRNQTIACASDYLPKQNGNMRRAEARNGPTISDLAAATTSTRLPGMVQSSARFADPLSACLDGGVVGASPAGQFPSSQPGHTKSRRKRRTSLAFMTWNISAPAPSRRRARHSVAQNILFARTAITRPAFKGEQAIRQYANRRAVLLFCPAGLLSRDRATIVR